jgi:predicted nucleic acid-binding protein
VAHARRSYILFFGVWILDLEDLGHEDNGRHQYRPAGAGQTRPENADHQGERLRPLILNGEVALADWIVLELMTGLRATEKPAELLARLSPVRRLPFPEDGWNSAWNLASNLRKRGVTPSAADCYVATVAMSANVPLIRCDADFEAVAKHSALRTRDWTAHVE